MVPDASIAFAALTLMASSAGGRPPTRPRARLAARAVRVRSRKSSTSNCPREDIRCNGRRPVPWSPCYGLPGGAGSIQSVAGLQRTRIAYVFLTNENHPEDQFAGATSSAAIRRTWDTLAADTFNSRVVSRTPRPSSDARRMRCTVNGVVLGRPRRLPEDRARSSPASTRSLIIARSNPLDTPSIPNKARPAGVLVSRACWCR
jgi:hypothetical protein